MILLYEGNGGLSIVNYKIYMKSSITKTYVPMKKAPVSHRCLFMEIFLFSGIQSTSESFKETFAVPPFDAKPLSLPLHRDYKGSGIFPYTLINKKVRIPKRTEGKGSIRSSFLE